MPVSGRDSANGGRSRRFLRSNSCPQQTGDRNRRDQKDNGNHNQQFYQRKTLCLSVVSFRQVLAQACVSGPWLMLTEHFVYRSWLALSRQNRA